MSIKYVEYSSLKELENYLLDKTEETIKKYKMITKNDKVPVAVSGGKDSATTLFVLDKLGYEVIPVIVDRGDDPLFNSRRIKNRLEKYGYDTEVLELRNSSYLAGISSSSAEKINEYLHKFDTLGSNESHCTPCYNARTIALIEFTKSLGSSSFAIGQHKTDSVTSLMKFYWTEIYYQKYTKPYGISYNGFKMEELTRKTDKIDLNLIEKLVHSEKAATDDPPVEVFGEIRLVRPIFEISEKIIEKYIKMIGFPYESGNCTWREIVPRPFRLIVQFDLYRRFEEDPELEDELFEYVLMGLNPDGTLKYRPRNKRINIGQDLNHLL